MAKKPEFQRLTENAIDFLNRAIDEFETEPKYSIINFYSAVELFLKARLLKEHWSLVVSRDPDRKKFESGDFHSVTFDEACSRLAKVVQSPISESATKNFHAVRNHRNRMVNFFHSTQRKAGDVESIALEQLRAWHDLNRLLTNNWKPLFNSYEKDFAAIEKKLGAHRAYFQAKFDSLKPSLDARQKAGASFIVCGSCSFKSAEDLIVVGDLHEASCAVCGYESKWLNFTCPACSEVSGLSDGGEFSCGSCGHTLSAEGIASELNEFVATKDNYFDAKVPANCSDCSSYHSIVEYKDGHLCVVCFSNDEELQQCGWCNEFTNSDMEYSYYGGCGFCDGKAGWDND
jgi:hypothetical protein